MSAKKVSEIKEQLGEELYFDIIEIFYLQMNDLLTEWQKPLPPPEQISSLAHKIKSSARNVGADILGELLFEIEKTPQLAHEKSILQQIANEFKNFKDLIDNMIHQK